MSTRRDPYSTPARRRRIIAEVAKKTLREYCVKACANVAILRKQTKSAIRLQCAFRSYLARKHARNLRLLKQRKASTKIQTALRMKFACSRVKRLKAERHLQRQIKLAQVVNNLRSSRKNRMAWLAFLIAKKLAREKRQWKAAIDIERVFRGHKARLLYHQMYQRHLVKIRQRNMAAVLVQSGMRRYLAKKRYLYWLTRRKGGWLIYKTVLKWWIRHMHLYNRSARTIQRYWRGRLGRVRAGRLRSEREHQREQIRQRETLLLQKLLLEQVVSELIHCTAQSCIPEEHTMDIHVDVSTALVQRMIAMGPRFVVEWCLDNSIVNYRHSSGYCAGAVVQQVVRSVDLALHTSLKSSPASDQTSSTPTRGEEKVVALTSWDEGATADTPHESILPSAWAQTVYDTILPTSTELITAEADNNWRCSREPNGAGLSVENVSVNNICLHIATLHLDSQSQLYTRNIVTIVFNSPHNEYGSDTGDGFSDDKNACAEPADLSEVKFRFKNVQVYVDSPTPVVAPVPLASQPIVETTEIEILDDSASDEEEEELKVLVAQEPRARPSTAVVRIVLRTPTPPPPPIDYNAKAIAIQMFLRRRYLHKARCARRIQRANRRSRLVFVWQEAVYSVLEIAHDAATIVQCWLRRAAAQRLLQRLKDEYERAHFVYGHDFTLSEETNWAAFGLSINDCVGDYFNSLYRQPVVQLSTQQVADNSRLPDDTRQQRLGKLLQATRPPAAGDILSLIEFPLPPPGCLQEPGMLTMLDLTDVIYNEGTGINTRAAKFGDDIAEDAIKGVSGSTLFSRDSFVHQLAVRRFFVDNNWDKAPKQPTRSTPDTGNNKTSNVDVLSAQTPIEEFTMLLWRQEHIGDILLDSCTELGAHLNMENVLSLTDLFQDNAISNDLHHERTNRTAPIYSLLARKFL